MKVNNPNNLPTIPIIDLLPTQGKLKDLTEVNYKKLKNTIEKRGFSVPVYVWEDSKGVKHLLDGHQRRRVLEIEGWNDPIPYLKIPAKDLQEAMARLLEITSQYGSITQEGIDQFIQKYNLPEAEVYEATAFDANIGEYEEETEVEEDEAPEVSSEPPKSKLGEIYQLGRHRVMCGDSTKDLQTLLDGKKPSMVFTDPPYGVDYQSRVDEEKRKGWGKIENDDLKGDALQDFITTVLDQTNDPRYVCCNWQSYIDFEVALGKPNALIVWDKGSIGLGAGYRNQHEFILFYGKLEHNSESNVWTIPRDNKYSHPTQKPIAIPTRAIGNSSKAGEVVLDYFLGSGSTLIACEQTDRTFYGMELDPKYVDVIRKRYAKFTSPDNTLPENWEELTPAINSVDKA